MGETLKSHRRSDDSANAGLLTWKGRMLLVLSVLKALSSIHGFGVRGPGLGNLGGAMTLLLKGFFIGEMGLRGDGTPTPTPDRKSVV